MIRDTLRDPKRQENRTLVPVVVSSSSELLPGTRIFTSIEQSKQVDSDGDLKLDEAEYCLAASLAEKVASTGGLEVNGTAHGLENEALESAILRPFETSSLLDESQDLLLSPASASLLTPDVSEESDLVGRGGLEARHPAMIRTEQPYESDSASLMSDLSFSRLAERSTGLPRHCSITYLPTWRASRVWVSHHFSPPFLLLLLLIIIIAIMLIIIIILLLGFGHCYIFVLESKYFIL
ncbi:unnamed protein product [Dibothriocephalus latus]|uniref:Uncharacterized protein n=1 Tax=Dibothriocephalus latus TaxID=60516 RepID=A0A3P7P008_DIBLA|nr:unnamed protein product [Dibothriocephalus latus]